MADHARRDAADVLAGIGRHWGWLLTFRIITAGIVVLIYPGISLVSLAVVLGVWLIVYGAMGIVSAFQLRGVGQAAARVAATT